MCETQNAWVSACKSRPVPARLCFLKRSKPMSKPISVETPDGGREHWFTAEDAAVFLGLSASTLSHYRSQGGGPIFYKLGWRIYYAKAHLIAWRSNQKWASTSKQLRDRS